MHVPARAFHKSVPGCTYHIIHFLVRRHKNGLTAIPEGEVAQGWTPEAASLRQPVVLQTALWPASTLTPHQGSSPGQIFY